MKQLLIILISFICVSCVKKINIKPDERFGFVGDTERPQLATPSNDSIIFCFPMVDHWKPQVKDWSGKYGKPAKEDTTMHRWYVENTYIGGKGCFQTIKFIK